MEGSTDYKIRSSAQGVFMMMTNGFGAVMGSLVSGWMIDAYFTHPDGGKMWHEIWLVFALYAFVIAIAFWVLFKHKHSPEDLKTITH